MSNARIEGWHFLASDRRLGYGDGRLVTVGETLTVDPGRLRLYRYGLHMCVDAIDALHYTRGTIICRVALGGRIIDTLSDGEDEIVASERTVLWMADADATLRAFARWCALQVIHLWDAPDVVRRYLETGDESIKDAAQSAARNAARNAAQSAAWNAAQSARFAAWNAAQSAQSAAWDAARYAAWNAGSDITKAKQNAQLECMLQSLEPKGG